MGRGPQPPKEVQLQIRVPKPGLGPGIFVENAVQEKRAAMSWADMSIVTDPGQKSREEPRTNPLPTGFELKDILAAIDTLYTDELKPYSRILRKRLAELAELHGQSDLDISVERLCAQCEASAELIVQIENAGEWSVVIAGRDQSFSDVYSPVDVYPATLWQCAATYFASLPDHDAKLPGGRYACAQMLKSRDLSFLRDRTLGQLSHIVQLAISQKKILGYSNGFIMPYCRSQSMIKDRCAEQRAPCITGLRTSDKDAKQTSPEMPLATWSVARTLLQEILKDARTAGKGHVPISNVKRIFRSRFQVDLSETALGHSKLSELLQDEALRDVCVVQMKGKGYVVVPARDASPVEPPVKTLAKCLQVTSEKKDSPPQFPPREGCIGTSVRNTFIHFSVPTSSKRRASSLPNGFGSIRHPSGALPASLTRQQEAKGCNTSDLETSVGDASCNASDTSEDVHRSIPPFTSGFPVCESHFDRMQPLHYPFLQPYAALVEGDPLAAAWHPSALVQRQEQPDGFSCQLPCSRGCDGPPPALRTPSPSPSPSNRCIASQAMPPFGAFMPMTCVFMGPAPQTLCFNQYV